MKIIWAVLIGFIFGMFLAGCATAKPSRYIAPPDYVSVPCDKDNCGKLPN